MDSALSEISEFIQAIPPMDLLPSDIIEQIVKEISISYVRRGQTLPPQGIVEENIYILRKGALSYFSADNKLLAKFSEGDICSVFCFSHNGPSTQHVISDEDTLLYSINYHNFLQLVNEYPDVTAFFQQTSEQRLNKKMLQVNEDAILNSSLLNSSIANFYHSPVVIISPDASIQQAAILMTEQNFSCLVISHNDQPLGIVTDKDIRRRCVAQGLSIEQPVSAIMTDDMTTIDINSTAYDALMKMTQKHIHHLPVTESNQLKGMVTVTDLMNNEGQNAVNITSVIHKATSVGELTEISSMIPKLQIRMAKLGTTADHVGKSISAITMAFTIRLIEMAEKLLGPPPVPYAWLAAGSQARQEQFAHSDQDNALIISNDLKPEHNLWFKDLATFVSDGLAACGFIYCPGNVMATNPQWCQTQKQWSQYFAQWINTPEPKALMHCSTFFDLTTVYGDSRLLEQVKTKMLQTTKRSTLFIAHLSRNALNLRPPLGFFRDFVLIQNGENKATLDLKHNGIAPIVDLARIYALSEGIATVNTIERLKQAAGTPSLSKSSAANLIDAYEFLSMLRMMHQAKKLQLGQQPNNYLSPKDISKLEREHLKDAFKVIKTLQDSRQSTY
ncbi:cyclic nucleotide-binding/CBS domain-containing protein [Colwellia sp. 6M3]|jgi:CBS domain-containing protein|uniref:putative nucleotidyltransferase substrate binding domain-containing protein n=1 Tax=Colwellia sp. 6M3 TaxID=2759849 RepID=UPI0015F58F39|nr:putative nucleotidyltransferase substrate binding domain-containing protein [Colwellia sp. 6M3]MBA6415123.1 cyclic nucleotide-binding/CBS domain-containing protein [Colwellia sp. 6M3]|tara:strand:+ start:4911 stop:6758 length:1848 start_codon:yes stop_codon:yes gene_type:complete